MKWLVLIHVLSAVIGVGPTFFTHVLLKGNQPVDGLRHSMVLMRYLEKFPKIGGMLAVLSGIALVVMNDYGSFLQIWLIGSLVLYIAIQVVVIGFISPQLKKLGEWLFSPENKDAASLPEEQLQRLNRINNLFYATSFMGTTLLILMILKPH